MSRRRRGGRRRGPSAGREARPTPPARGAYIARDADGDRQITLIASGSEVGIALAAQAGLAAEGVAAAVVSAPCLELFWQQDAGWRESVIGDTPRIVIEAALRQPWDRLLRDGDEFVGMDDFGASAPAPALYEHFGITADAVMEKARACLS